jgi:hypothetical protein
MRYRRIRWSISSNGYNGIAIRAITLHAFSGGWKFFVEGAVRAGEVDICHDLPSCLGGWALPINILNISCHYLPENDLFNSNNWIRE